MRALPATMDCLLLLCAATGVITTDDGVSPAAGQHEGSSAPAMERQVRPRPQPARPPARPLATPIPITAVSEPLTIQLPTPEPGRGHAQHNVKKKKKLNEFAKKYWPLLLIPLAIQAKVIPLVVFKLKLLALKALLIGKIALLVLAINALRSAVLGDNDEDEQYSADHLANEHYGYNGGPEYGAWINRRRDLLAFKAQQPHTAPTYMPLYEDPTTDFTVEQTAWPSS